MKGKTLNEITEEIIAAAIEVHRALGPGLLESTYETCLAYELRRRELHFEQQKHISVMYKDVRLDAGYRIDLLVENAVVVEVKAVEILAPLHQAQLLSYLRFSKRTVGLLINFNVRQLRFGIRRIVNNFSEPLRPLRSLR